MIQWFQGQKEKIWLSALPFCIMQVIELHPKPLEQSPFFFFAWPKACLWYTDSKTTSIKIIHNFPTSKVQTELPSPSKKPKGFLGLVQILHIWFILYLLLDELNNQNSFALSMQGSFVELADSEFIVHRQIITS